MFAGIRPDGGFRHEVHRDPTGFTEIVRQTAVGRFCDEGDLFLCRGMEPTDEVVSREVHLLRHVGVLEAAREELLHLLVGEPGGCRRGGHGRLRRVRHRGRRGRDGERGDVLRRLALDVLGRGDVCDGVQSGQPLHLEGLTVEALAVVVVRAVRQGQVSEVLGELRLVVDESHDLLGGHRGELLRVESLIDRLPEASDHVLRQGRGQGEQGGTERQEADQGTHGRLPSFQPNRSVGTAQ